MYALFEFADGNTILVGQWNWIYDHRRFSPDDVVRKRADVIVRWPKDKQLLGNLGRSNLDTFDASFFEAKVLAADDDITILREIADTMTSSKSNKDQNTTRKRSHGSDNDIKIENTPKRPKSKQTQEPNFVPEIPEKMRQNHRTPNQAIDWNSSSDEQTADNLHQEKSENQISADRLKARVKYLEKENEQLKERLSNIHEMVSTVALIPRQIAEFKDYMRNFTIHSTATTSTADGNADAQEEKVRLWGDIYMDRKKYAVLWAKRHSLRDFTNTLMRTIHTREVLGNSSLSGKSCNAQHLPPKPCLPHADEAIDFIHNQLGADIKEIKGALTRLLNTESRGRERVRDRFSKDKKELKILDF